MNTLTEEARAELRRLRDAACEEGSDIPVQVPTDRPHAQAFLYALCRNSSRLIDAANERDRLAEEVKAYADEMPKILDESAAHECRARYATERGEAAEAERSRLRGHLAVAVKALETIEQVASSGFFKASVAAEALATIRSGQQEGNGND